ncbi:MAG: hypothetical protein ACREBG_29175 [Pyrinomonadaceae bacterium]
MTKRRLTIFCLSLVVFAPAILGFKCGSSPPPPTGFNVRTLFVVTSPTGVIILRRGVPALVAGSWQFDQGAANGTVTTFNTTTNASGNLTVSGARVPALWQFHRGPIPPCSTIGPFNANMTAGITLETGCIVTTVANLTSSPNPVNSQSTPQPFDISGAGMDTTYGMPKVEYFDDYGYFVGEAVASSVSGSPGYAVMYGTSPNLTSLYDGSYTLLISNPTVDGWEATGYTSVQTYGNPEPPPDPGGGCAPGRLLPIMCE